MMNLGIYIHLPYCIHRCVYCDFNAYALKTKQELTSYIIALKKEILFYAQKISNTKIVDTLYFGGWTPSVHSSEQIQELVNLLRTEFNVSPSLEITLEANPSSLSLEKLKAFKDARINRLSLGVQTFHPQHLKTLERVHSAKQAEEANRMAQEVGFKNINLDFIFGIPQQSLEEFKKDIGKAMDLNPTHISTYNLTVDKTNPLFPNLPMDELQRDMYEYVIQYLPSKGYEHYEVSAFSKPTFQCQHNLKYWKLKNYLGLGAGAYSYIASDDHPWGVHFKNSDPLKMYWEKVMNQGHAMEEEENISIETVKKEYMITHLRLLEGIQFQDFEDRFKESIIKSYGCKIDMLFKKGFLDSTQKMLKLTSKGLVYLNQVLLEFV